MEALEILKTKLYKYWKTILILKIVQVSLFFLMILAIVITAISYGVNESLSNKISLMNLNSNISSARDIFKNIYTGPLIIVIIFVVIGALALLGMSITVLVFNILASITTYKIYKLNDYEGSSLRSLSLATFILLVIITSIKGLSIIIPYVIIIVPLLLILEIITLVFMKKIVNRINRSQLSYL
ncbi:hypothetical protein GE118_00550 [Mycoplasma sp. NEAQ87857]|uniref:hypothetical protein n=1 Tax=Mycoplasma sp. NEAQ87857 TaxID=2683967 RepID=UPI0013189875|nr:hypothetical protein [Mycoplasma sp. NEAQ87857]QGZ97293.1 hypothetical protein GE118_00550 [Mycoplasma sp. NEAQ87857]